MKKLLLLFIVTGLVGHLTSCGDATEVSYASLFSSTPKNIRIYMHNASVQVVGYMGNEIKIETLGEYTMEHDQRAEGLKSLSGYGTDNTRKGLSLKEKNGEIVIAKVARRQIDYKILVPKNAHIILEETTWTGGGNYEIADLKGDVEVHTKISGMHFNNVEGAIKARSTSGSVKLYFDNFKAGNYHDISLISGNIDITLPESAKTDLVMQTVSGEIYTDFEFPQDKSAHNNPSHAHDEIHANVRKSLNGGGSTMRLKTISSNIYLREKK